MGGRSSGLCRRVVDGLPPGVWQGDALGELKGEALGEEVGVHRGD